MKFAHPRICSAALFALLLPGAKSLAHGEPALVVGKTEAAKLLDQITVLGRKERLVGEAISASQGVISAEQMATRPISRMGDLAEFVPGLIATQHSGSGKANQYFLRGFNLDHGSDFASFVEGMPVNLRSHGHGQGWADLNFVIPEMVGEVSYRKGPYYADSGDFSAAGSAHFKLARGQNAPSVLSQIGENGYHRVVSTAGFGSPSGSVNMGLEAQGYDGPWRDVAEDVQKRALIIRGDYALGAGQLYGALMTYKNRWNSADQIPERAVLANTVSRLGQLDTDVGGATERTSLSGGFRGNYFDGVLDVSIYGIDHELDLFSNFTYFLDDPLSGDEFQQFDARKVYGGQITQSYSGELWSARFGVESRMDDIDRVGLSRTAARGLVRPVRDDQVREQSFAFYLDGERHLTDQLRVYFGARFDELRFKVQGLNCAEILASCLNSGEQRDQIVSPKMAVTYTWSDALEFYLNGGRGFHSNDARGTTIRFDPLSGDPVEPVTPLAASKGAELGGRWFLNDKLSSTMAIWALRADSELVFVGDAGTTEAGRASRRAGVEFGAYYFANDQLGIDFEASYTRSRFTQFDPAGDRIPGSIPLTLALGVNSRWANGLEINGHLRHFGAYPLIEDDSTRSKGATVLNFSAKQSWGRFTASLNLLNALNSKDHDIDYFYASRLPGEGPEGVEDRHFRSLEPRTVRLGLGYQF